MKWYRIISLIGFIFILNLAWEFFSSSLYVYSLDMDISQHIWISSFAGLGIILSILLAVSLGHKGLDWIDNPKPIDYLVITALGMFTSLRIETSALTAGSWFYSRFMPTILGIGLVPLIQLFTTAIISLIIIKKINPAARQNKF